MLRSYQYTEKSYMDFSLQNDILHEREIEIAHQYVETYPVKQLCKELCPICGKGKGRHFYTKWNVEYLCCEVCKSVYAVYDRKIVEGYLKEETLQALRLSEEYQGKITENRSYVWQEFLEWIEVRAFRFMRRSRNLNIIDIGNRLKGYSEAIRQAVITGNYDLRDSVLQESSYQISDGRADLVFYLDQMKTEMEPRKKLLQFSKMLKEDGLLVLNARAGSGFDIITLRERNKEIYPYEHILLPSVRGLTQLLTQCGFKVLEITTPGVMDLKYVKNSLDKLDERESFVRYLLEEADSSMLQEFQRFLQKSCLSSFVCVIARKGIVL